VKRQQKGEDRRSSPFFNFRARVASFFQAALLQTGCLKTDLKRSGLVLRDAAANLIQFDRFGQRLEERAG
jgi:hypothetical protein